jgi:hypothetical protein
MTRLKLFVVALAPIAVVVGIGVNEALSKTNETTMTCRVMEANGHAGLGIEPRGQLQPPTTAAG